MQAELIAAGVAIVLGYLLGSVPFGLILTRAAGLGDIRGIGSGNIGATNVLRTGNKGLAAATLLLDAAKGAVAVLLARHFAPGTEVLAGGAAFVGHCYPVWLNFRGGKGIATALGILVALSPVVALVSAAFWAATLALFRISSLASLTATVAAPVFAALWNEFELAALLIVLALITIWKHRANIERLMAGTEPRVGRKQN